MKSTMLVLLAALSFTATAATAATTDDVKWINQCVADNKGDAKAEGPGALRQRWGLSVNGRGRSPSLDVARDGLSRVEGRAARSANA